MLKNLCQMFDPAWMIIQYLSHFMKKINCVQKYMDYFYNILFTQAKSRSLHNFAFKPF